MRSRLGIELGPGRCVLVLVEDDRVTGGAVRAAAHLVVKYTDPERLALDLRRMRIEHRLPRRARVVLWPHAGDAGVSSVDDPSEPPSFRPGLWQLRERLRPLVRAGFRVSAALAPADAAAALSALGAASPAAVLAVAPEGGIIVVAAAGRPLLTRAIVWKFAPPAADATLLDRYVFAAQVLPVLEHAMREARAHSGVRVERLVLCGSSPALRTLAAPLIEELDLEVETLDGLGGVPAPEAEPDVAAALQLAAAAVLAPDDAGVVEGLTRPVVTPAMIVAGATAAAAVILLVLLFWPARQASVAPAGTSPASGVSKSRRAGPLPDFRDRGTGFGSRQLAASRRPATQAPSRRDYAQEDR